jgi:hypothetical protein
MLFGGDGDQLTYEEIWGAPVPVIIFDSLKFFGDLEGYGPLDPLSKSAYAFVPLTSNWMSDFQYRRTYKVRLKARTNYFVV